MQYEGKIYGKVAGKYIEIESDLPAELAALRAENEALVRERENALFQAHNLIAKLQGKSAENAKLREVLENIANELPQTPKLPLVGKIKELSETALKSTTPDPLYTAAPEMLKVLQVLWSNRPKTFRPNDLQEFGSWFCKAWERDIEKLIAHAKTETA